MAAQSAAAARSRPLSCENNGSGLVGLGDRRRAGDEVRAVGVLASGPGLGLADRLGCSTNGRERAASSSTTAGARGHVGKLGLGPETVAQLRPPGREATIASGARSRRPWSRRGRPRPRCPGWLAQPRGQGHRCDESRPAAAVSGSGPRSVRSPQCRRPRGWAQGSARTRSKRRATPAIAGTGTTLIGPATRARRGMEAPRRHPAQLIPSLHRGYPRLRRSPRRCARSGERMVGSGGVGGQP